MMNKYKEAFREVERNLQYSCSDAIDTLYELVCKATPMKPVIGKKFTYYLRCPNCNEFAEEDGGGRYEYCPCCGQKLDWS